MNVQGQEIQTSVFGKWMYPLTVGNHVNKVENPGMSIQNIMR